MSFKEVPLVENVSLTGATLREISDIINRYIQAYTNVHSVIHAYFILAENEYWRPEREDIIVNGQYSIVPVPSGELTQASNLRNWEYSFNQVLNDLPIKEKEYLDMIKEMRYRIPYIADLYIQEGQIQVLLVMDIIKRFEVEVLGDTFQNVQNRIITRTDQYQQIYVNKLNRYWELQRKYELTIRMEQLYPPINTGVNVVRIIEFNVITNDEINELDALKNYDLNNAKTDYIREVNNEIKAHEEGVRFPDSPGLVPLRLSLLPIKAKPIRPTIIEIGLDAQNRFPPLPDRELSDKEFWNIKYAKTITQQNNIYNMAISGIQQIQNTYNTQDCTQIPDELYLDCVWYNNVRSITTQNLSYLLKEKQYPEDPEANLIAIPSRPSQEEINAYIAQKEAERLAAEEAERQAILRRQLEDVYREIETIRGQYRQATLYWVGLYKAFGPNDSETINARNIKEAYLNQLISKIDQYETAAGFTIKEHLQILIDDFITLREDQRARGETKGVLALDSEVYTLRQIYKQRYAVIDPITNVLTLDDWYIQRFGSS